MDHNDYYVDDHNDYYSDDHDDYHGDDHDAHDGYDYYHGRNKGHMLLLIYDNVPHTKYVVFEA